MPNLIVPKNYVCFANVNDIHTLCEPLLFNSEVDMFTYVRVYKDGNFFHIGTYTEYEKYVLYDLRCEASINYKLLDTIQNSVRFSKNKDNKKSCWFVTEIFREDYWHNLYNGFNIDSYFCISEKVADYYEVFFFASRSRKNISSFYLNHHDALENFMLYFKEYGADLLKLGEKNKIIIPPERNLEFHRVMQNLEKQVANENSAGKIGNSFKLKKYPLHRNGIKFYITPSELKCLKFLAQGYSAKETANVLQLSFRTVETHLQNMKDKLGFFSSGQLLKAYHTSTLKDIGSILDL